MQHQLLHLVTLIVLALLSILLRINETSAEAVDSQKLAMTRVATFFRRLRHPAIHSSGHCADALGGARGSIPSEALRFGHQIGYPDDQR